MQLSVTITGNSAYVATELGECDAWESAAEQRREELRSDVNLDDSNIATNL